MTTERNKEKPSLDNYTPKETKTATFAMGCFWSPDALFGSLNGVLRTRVGYAGGSTDNPTYWHLADHIESLQLDYEPEKISYQELLSVFFNNHNTFNKPWKRQYMSALFYHTEEQEQLILEVKSNLEDQLNQEIHTAVYPYKKFYLAEDRHQKYKLQRHSGLMAELNAIYPEFADLIDSTAAARINGYLYGYGNREALKATVSDFGLSPAGVELLLKKALALKDAYQCSG